MDGWGSPVVVREGTRMPPYPGSRESLGVRVERRGWDGWRFERAPDT